MSGHLIVYQNGRDVQTVALGGETCTLGRLPENTLVLNWPTVSGHHAELRDAPDGAAIVDLGSTNGTVVDGVRLAKDQPHLLSDGSEISIGPYRLIYRVPGMVQAPSSGGAEPATRVTGPSPTEDRAALPDLIPLRADSGAWRAPGPGSAYLAYLPLPLQESDFLRRFLLMFESIWEPLEWRQDHLSLYIDPRTCPPGLLPWLAGWLGAVELPSLPEGYQRRVLGEAIALLRLRGTTYGLQRLLELSTPVDVRPRIVEEAGRPYVFRVSLSVPAAAEVDLGTIEHLIQTHKPAHAGYILDVRYE